MFLIGLIAQIILGLFFTPEGVIKWTHIGPSTARFEHFRYPRWFRYLTGVCEFLAGIGLLIGLWFPLLAVLAALLLCIVMIGASTRMSSAAKILYPICCQPQYFLFWHASY